jgi:isoquinoline 1-oxidoreductase
VDLLSGQELRLSVADDVPLKGISEFNVMGRAARRTDAVAKVTGRAKYSRDLSLPGMLYGKVLRPPSNGSTLDRVDTTRAERVPGVVQLMHENDFVGVVAEREDIAEYAVSIIRARWNDGAEQASDWELPSLLKEKAKEPVSLREEGNLERAFEEADHVIEGVYYAPYIANSQMEPSAAMASWDGDRLTVWCGNRAPFQERDQLASFFGLEPDNVRVIAAEVGGSFGTKTATVGLEAARLAKAAGRPVRLSYSRAEEFSWSTMRPAALMEVRSGYNDDGEIIAWDYIAYHAGENAFRGRRGADTPYDTKNVRIAVANSITPLLSGSYRSLGGAVNHFAREAHLDEIAFRLGMDPLMLRLRNLSHPRMRRVLELAASTFGWPGREKSAGKGFGLAVGYDAGSYAAECIEVTVQPGDVRVNRVVAGFDCGLVVNPVGASNQVEGSIMLGIGNALWESIEFDGGRVLNPGFGHYRVPRIADAPDIRVEFIDNPDEPSTGTGEPGMVPVAGAIANAVRDATGIAIDRLPIVPDLR